ncbi:MAG TPA: exonuclease SbcCD subunit D, partial [Thermosipho africanus]|nr:exonuclease SbcCD subunit D [Thermosipho africanus]
SWGNIFSKNADDTSKLISTLKRTEKEEDLIDIFDEFLNKLLEGEKDDN